MNIKINRIFLMFVGALTVFTNKAEAIGKSPVTLKWTLNGNFKDGGESAYDATFCIVNNTSEALDNNWALYFCQLPTPVKQEIGLPLKIEEVASSYFRLSPTTLYKPIASGDSLSVCIHFSDGIIRMSNGPEGAFIVKYDKRGKEMPPITVPVLITPFTKETQWSCPGRRELPYSSGEKVFNDNTLFSQMQPLKPTDIFPTLKSADYTNGSFLFTNSVKLIYDSSINGLGTYLRSYLSSAFNCSFANKATTTIQLKLDTKKAITSDDEHYQIKIHNGEITIIGASPHALFDGIQSLVSIISNQKILFSIPNMEISDYPDLKYRGLLLDVSRDFTTKSGILKLIDLLAQYKMNVLHMHLGDDEGWRLQIPGLPELTEVGARRGYTTDEQTCLYPAYCGGWNANDKNSSANGYYSKADFEEILRYAKSRFVTIIPEFDMPGHSRAAIKAMNARYNKYIATDPIKAKEYMLTDLKDTSRYETAQLYTDNVINVALPSTYRFVEKVLDEVNKMYKEVGVPLTLFHLGGDEVPQGAWEGSNVCRVFLKEKGLKTTHEMKDYFIAKVIGMLQEKGIGLGAWQEVAVLSNGKVNQKFAGQKILSYCWNTLPERDADEIPYRLANAGFPVILSNVSNLYFDLAYCKHPQEFGADWGGFVSERESFDLLPFNLYASIHRTFDGQPVDMNSSSQNKLALDPAKQSEIKGIQGQLWSETIRNFGMIEYYLFPKMFGLIERAWNSHPQWENDPTGEAYLDDLKKYNSKIVLHEFPRLNRQKVVFRLAQPGLKLEGGKLYANTSISGAQVRYTIDGSEPTMYSEQWIKPITCESKIVKAKTFYLGKESVTTTIFYGSK